MKTLKEFIDAYGNFCDDLTILREYCKQDEVLKYIPNLLTDVLQSQIDKKNVYIHSVRSNMINPNQYPDNFEKEDAYELDYLTRKMQLSFPFTERDIKWMKEFDKLPDKPIPFWHDLYEVIQYYKGKTEKKPELFCHYECELPNREDF